MKPTFALDLTRGAIALLHRTPKGWNQIGEVDFEAPDMAEALDVLRKTALGLSPLGLACKVILPNSQILYSEIHAPGPSREDKRRQIAAALQGRTPYAVEDLVFDWSGKGTTVKVAVVARETLEEAESFAVTHRLNPVSFVAIPDEGTFIGEAWFGPSVAADTILAPGETVERDRDAVSITSRVGGEGPVEPEEPVAEPAGDEALPGLQEALDAEVTEADLRAAAARMAAETAPDPEVLGFDDLSDLEDEPLPGPRDPVPDLPQPELPEPELPEPELPEPELPEPELPEPELPEPELPKPELPEPELPVFVAAPRAAIAAPDPIRPASAWDDLPPLDLPPMAEVPPVGPTVAVDPDEAPFADVPELLALAEDEPAPQVSPAPDSVPDPAPPTAAARPTVSVLDDLDDDIPPAPSSAAMFAFASRRGAAKAATPQPDEAAARPTAPVVPAPSADRPAAPAARFGADRVTPVATGPVTAPTIPGQRPKAKVKIGSGSIARPVLPEKAASAPVTVKSPVRPGGTFGNAPPPRNRSRVTFMVLIGMLLLCLALVAAWASFFLTQSEEAANEAAVLDMADLPGVDDEMAADLQDPEALVEVLPEGDPAATSDPDAATDAALDAALAVEDQAENMGGDTSGPVPEASVAAELADAALAGDPAAGSDAAEAGVADAGDDSLPGSTITTEVSASQSPVEDQDEIFLSAMDAPPPALDALALPALSAMPDSPPDSPMPPPAFGTVYQFDEQGLLLPTPEGILSPEGVMLIAGKPPLVPPPRSPVAEAAAAALAPPAAPADPALGEATAADASLVTAGAEPVEVAPLSPADPALAGFRPRPRPAGLVPPDDGALLLPETLPGEVITTRPLARPATILAAAAAANPDSAVADLGAQGASLAAQAEARLAAAAALEAENPSIVAISMRPAPRPSDLSGAVEAAVAAAVREPDPVPDAEAAAPEDNSASDSPGDEAELDEPEPEAAAPSIPTKASVAAQATYENAINLSKINLIGTYGTDSQRYALIRQANGKYKKVEVGDKIDGGVIKAITDTEVRYQKGGKLITLKMPKA